VPSGARKVVSALKNGDILLLVGQLSRNDLDFARFFYAGRVIYIAPGEEFAFSKALWGDGGFPLIFFMQGALIDYYTWRDFTNDFQMAQNYYVAGQTMRVSSERLSASQYESTEGFAHRLGISAAQLRITHHPLTEQLAFEEGDRSLKTHLAVERSSQLIKEFKASLSDFRCSLCGFDFENIYGEMGRAFVEAHHSVPLAQLGRQTSTFGDLIAVCSNCHRMLHRNWPAHTVEAVKAALSLSRSKGK
jgi:5-methylcytosine-specific restriction enzyme A